MISLSLALQFSVEPLVLMKIFRNLLFLYISHEAASLKLFLQIKVDDLVL